jgi:Na+-driven multidrug efflux pump
VGNILIQSVINSYAATVPGIIGGFSSATKLLYLFVNLNGAVDSALASYAAQNIGAKRFDRVKDGLKAGYLLCLAFCIPATLVFLIFPEFAMGIFVPAESTDVIAAGVSYLRTVSPFLALVAIKQVCDGILHGAGAAKMFATTTFIDLLVRVALAYILPLWIGHWGIWLAWPIGWITGMFVSVYFYRCGKWKEVHLLDHL